jgi:translin
MNPSDFAQQLDGIAAEIRTYFDNVDTVRERALMLSREIVRDSAEAIKCVHRGQYEEAEQRLAESRQRVQVLLASVKDYADLSSAGFVLDSCKEHAEAVLTLALATDRPLPSIAEVGINPATYINGMAEAVGELRRYVLDSIRRGQIERSEYLLNLMDDIYDVLVSYDYPEAVTQGLRRRTDAARGIIERTRGDLTTALRQQELAKAMEELERKLNAQKEGDA